MTPIRITIPAAKPLPVEQAAGQIVIDALREAGMNPASPAVARNPMVGACVREWGRGDWTRGQFVKAMRNLLILNPKLGE